MINSFSPLGDPVFHWHETKPLYDDNLQQKMGWHA